MRYIGNKKKLLSEINKLILEKDLMKKGLIFCDAFSGTATVSSEYKGFFRIIANDILDFSYEYSAGVLLYNNSNFKKLGFNPFTYFSEVSTSNYTKGFCYNNFSPNGGCQYFSDENAKKIDYIRTKIEQWHKEEKISGPEKSYLIACLLESISKVSNVAGVYSAFLKIWDPRAKKELQLMPIEVKTSRYKNQVLCKDASELVSTICGDILYLDPPYTPTQYNSQYHVLETIVRNDSPITHGIGKHRDNDRLSKWCKKGEVEFEFEKLIKNANFQHIVFSYSDKGIMSASFIEAVLKRYCVPGTFVFKKIEFPKYKSTRAVERENATGTKKETHYEYLFYIEKSREVKHSSPLNYIGGKYKTIDLIVENFPKKIDTFYDLFGGGATVAINTPAKKIVYNDINKYVVDLLEYLKDNEPPKIFKEVKKIERKFGLEKGNKDSFLKLRSEYNKNHSNVLLYLLICYGFEHQIRFNKKHEFNNPCGNSGFSDQLYEKLISFYLRCKDINIEFRSGTYKEFISAGEENDLFYFDPPYLGNNGAYQDGKRGFNGWDLEQEIELRAIIDTLNKRGRKFMLSNYIDHSSGNINPLKKWIDENNYSLIPDDCLIKRNRQSRREIIIKNFGDGYGN